MIASLANEVRDELLEAKPSDWDRYDNPFEQKWVLRTEGYTEHMRAFMRQLQARVVEFKDCELDTDNQYTAYFKYDVGDYLDIHLDAGICPTNGKRKAITVLHYLSSNVLVGGDLEFRDGAGYRFSSEPCTFGKSIVFKNSDTAWHGNPYPVSAGVKLVATVSFLSSDHRGYSNMRQRAFFIPTVRQWDVATYKLRDQRCDPVGYKEAYVVGR